MPVLPQLYEGDDVTEKSATTKHWIASAKKAFSA